MLTAVAIAAAVLIPPTSVSVRTETNLPRALVDETLEEAAAIWRAADVTFSWKIGDGGGSLSALRVTIGDSRGPGSQRGLAIGWIVFDGRGMPTPDIYLSYLNAMELTREEEGVAAISRMTQVELRTQLARMLGRALAHELGHYLLGTKAHTPEGLMKARRPASDFLGLSRDDFNVDLSLQSLVRARLMLADNLARR
jgi:hypothetical protein